MEERIFYDNCVKVGWKTVKLGDFIDFVGGGTPDKKNPDYWNGDIKWASVKDVKNKYLHKTQDKITKLGLENSSSQLAKNGELILVTRISPGKCVIAKDNIAINQDLKIVKLKADVSTNFVYYFFTAKENEFIKRSSGTTVKGIRLEEIRVIEIDLPPLHEQRAIVTKIELLFSELDNGIFNLKLAQEQLKVYRQAVLKKAFEGELTKEWREKQTNLPTADELLREIEKEYPKNSVIERKKPKKIMPLNQEEIAELPLIPREWRWVKNEDYLYEVKDGTHDTPKYVEHGVPFVTQKNIRENGLDLTNVKYISQSNHERFYQRSNVAQGDIIISMIGINRGMCCIVNTDKIFSIKNVGLFKFLHNLQNNRFSLYYYQSLIGLNLILSKSKGGAQPFIGLTELRNWPAIVCSLPEQQAIVQEIETRLSVCDKIEQDIADNLEKAEALRQSILKKAFDGKLLNEKELAEVRGAEDWEPAEALLGKIKVEKAGNGTTGKQATERLKSIIQDDKGLIQQATLQAFEQIDK